MQTPASQPVLVIDFGAQYAQLIARRVREARVFSEVLPHTATVEDIKATHPQAIVLSGGPSSVYDDGAPQLDAGIFDLGVPVFGICYGFQAMAQALGGTVAHTGTSEYGLTGKRVDDVDYRYNPYAAMAEDVVFSVGSILDDYRLLSVDYF